MNGKASKVSNFSLFKKKTNKQTNSQITKWTPQTLKLKLLFMLLVKKQQLFATMICALKQHIMCNFKWCLNYCLLTSSTLLGTGGHFWFSQIPLDVLISHFSFLLHYIAVVLHLEWFHHNCFFLSINTEFVFIAELYFVCSKVTLQ